MYFNFTSAIQDLCPNDAFTVSAECARVSILARSEAIRRVSGDHVPVDRTRGDALGLPAVLVDMA